MCVCLCLCLCMSVPVVVILVCMTHICMMGTYMHDVCMMGTHTYMRHPNVTEAEEELREQVHHACTPKLALC